MSSFEFDDTKSPDENILLFIEHLKTLDNDLAEILKANISALLAIPEGPARNVKRAEVNAQIQSALDIL